MHKPFDLHVCAGMTVDIMHCVFLGIMAKTLITFWFGVSHRLKPFSAWRKVHQYMTYMDVYKIVLLS